MTEKIKSAIKELKQIPQHIGEDCDGYELRALRLAINSLKAWDEVLNELYKIADDFNDFGSLDYASGLEKAIDIINQKLSEVENGTMGM